VKVIFVFKAKTFVYSICTDKKGKEKYNVQQMGWKLKLCNRLK